MTLLYVTGNLVDSSTLDSVTTEDTIYVKEYLYNRRPSLTFRFTTNTGNQIKVDMGAATAVTFVGVINHNLEAPTKFQIKAAAADPPAGGDWDNPDWEDDLALCTGLNNSYLNISQTYRYWVLDIDDATNPYNVEIGEFILSTHANFGATWHLVASSEGPVINVANSPTHYGQDWDDYRSEGMRFELAPLKETTVGSIDAIRTFLEDLEGSAGRFVLIPDDTYCHCYYVKPEGLDFIAQRIYHSTNDVRDWSLTFKELVKGISLL